MDTRHEAAAKKRKLVQELIEKGLQPIVVLRQVKEQFGTGINGSYIYACYHEFHGTTPDPRRGRRCKKPRKKLRSRKKKTPPHAQPTAALVPTKPLDVQAMTSASPTVDALLPALLRAMRAEGVDSLTLRADGRGTVYHVLSREISIGGSL